MIGKKSLPNYFLPMIFLFAFTSAEAATFTVTRNDDRNLTCASATDCSLREAIKAANLAAGNDIINFDPSVILIQLTSALPQVSSTISILGGSGVTVSGDKTNAVFRPFHVVIAGVGNLTMDRITVIDGKEFVGGGLWNQGATATLTNCTFSGNEATGDAGGVYNTGTMTISNSVINVNSAVFKGGGIANGGTLTIIESTVGFNSSNQPGSTLADSTGGGIHNVGFLTISHSAIAGNITAGNGGGIYNSAVSAVRIINSTISFNSAFQGNGGGIYDIGAGSTLRNVTIATNLANFAGGYWNNDLRDSFLLNTIVADNDGVSGSPDVFGRFNNSFNSLIGKADGATGLAGNGNIVGTIALPVNPLLNALASNGGATQTHSFSSNMSPAINAGSNSLALDQNNQPLTTDQRGTGFSRINNTTVDIGAFESSAVTAANVSIGGRILTADGRGIAKARITLTNESGESRFAVSNPFGYYRFDEVPTGETYIFTVENKSYTFAPQIVTINELNENLNFTALQIK